jgi:hypothetical protein
VPQKQKNYMYQPKTATANLRNHLTKVHDAVYKAMCEEKGWSYGSSKAKKATVGDQRKNALPPFSPETFVEYLVRFVTADDQVSRVPVHDSNAHVVAGHPRC